MEITLRLFGKTNYEKTSQNFIFSDMKILSQHQMLEFK